MDYVLTYVTGYFGILAALALLGLILYLIGRLFHISLGQKNRLGMLMGAGCCVAMLAQIGVYVLCNLGILLPGEVYCPFITTGGSVMLVTYLCSAFCYPYAGIRTSRWKKKTGGVP